MKYKSISLLAINVLVCQVGLHSQPEPVMVERGREVYKNTFEEENECSLHSYVIYQGNTDLELPLVSKSNRRINLMMQKNAEGNLVVSISDPEVAYDKANWIDEFHMQQFAYIINRMKTTDMADGSTLLDHSIITCGAGLGDGATHQFFDLPMLVAGNAQGQIKQGRYVAAKNGTPHSNLWLSVAQLMGLEIDSFADSNGTISDLWT